MSEKFISIEGIARHFAAPGGGKTTVFRDIWFSIPKGEFVCMIGHSGCGKTTVLNILSASICRMRVWRWSMARRSRGPSLDRAVIFQSHALLPWRTVLGNVAYAVSSKWRDWSRAKIEEHAKKFIEKVGLKGSERRSPRSSPAA